MDTKPQEGSGSLSFAKLRENLEAQVKQQYEVVNQKNCATELLNLVTKFELAYEAEKEDENLQQKKLAHHFPVLDMTAYSQASRLSAGFLHFEQIAERASQLSRSVLCKHLAKRNDVWRELLASERAYFFHLVSLVETYEKPINSYKTPGGKPVTTPKDSKTIFQNISKICAQSKTIYIQLEGALKNWPDLEPSVGKMFNYKIKAIREEYTNYFKGLALAYHTYNKSRRSSVDFCQFIDSQKPFDMNGELDVLLTLPTLLMLPLLRLSEYEKVIKLLHSYPPAEQEEYAALSSVKDAFEALRTELHQDERSCKMLAKEIHLPEKSRGEIGYSFLDWKGAFLTMLVSEMSRVPDNLKRQGPITVALSNMSGIQRDYYMYIFTNILVVAEVLGDKFKYFYNYYPLAGAEVEVTGAFGNLENLLTLTTKNRVSIILGCSTAEERNSYVNDFRQVISVLEKSEEGQVKTQRNTRSNNALKQQRQLSFRFQKSLHTEFTVLVGSIAPFAIKQSKTKNKIVFFQGPDTRDEHEVRVHNGLKNMAARSRSLFPYSPIVNGRLNGPVSEAYGFCRYGASRVMAVCDAQCNGTKGMVTAHLAVRYAIREILAISEETKTSKQVAENLIHSVSAIHDYLITSNGTTHTSLLIGWLLPAEDGKAGSVTKFFWVTVGRSKAFCRSPNGKIQQITKNYNYKPGDRTGGVIGEFLPSRGPDLRDFRIGCFEPQQGDHIFILTDGIIDNFDPQVLGFSPRDLASIAAKLTITPQDKWTDLNPEATQRLKSAYTLGLLKKILKPSQTEMTSTHIINLLFRYVSKITAKARDIALNQHTYLPTLKDPNAKGLLDDATALCFQLKSAKAPKK